MHGPGADPSALVALAPMAQPGLQAWPPTAEAIAAYKARLNEQDIMDVFARLLITDTPE